MRFVKKFFIGLAIIFFSATFSGCESERVTLLPNSDGSQSALILKTEKGEQVIDKPYQSISVSQTGAMSSDMENPESVKGRYAEALDAQPQRPVSYTIYFVTGQDKITPESLLIVESLKADLKTRRVPEITVIGHTDRLGSEKENDALSLKRANVMRSILLADGITAENIEIAGRGEREPLVPTADEVPEPKNRRVEISIR